MMTVYLLQVDLIPQVSICTEGRQLLVRKCPSSQDQLGDACRDSRSRGTMPQASEAA